MQSVEWYRERRLCASLSDSDKAAIIADYNAATGSDFNKDFKQSCPNKYSDAIYKIHYIMVQKYNNSGYILKRGVAFRYKGSIITRHNLTKEAAEWFISQDINNRDKFEELANDWDSYEGKDIQRKTSGNETL